MLTNKKLSSFLIVIAVASAAALQTLGQDSALSEQERKRKEYYSQFPTAYYNAPEESDPEKRAKRILKNKRYDKGQMMSVISDAPDDDGQDAFLITEDLEFTPGLPINESELIVIGEIADANAYLSNNKRNVYSEFSFRISEVLKKNDKGISKGDSISVDREGGYVLYDNGKKRLYSIGGLSMPRVGRRYVLFLKNPEKTPNYEIVSGYELNADGTKNLNGSDVARVYAGMAEEPFLKAVRKAVAGWFEFPDAREKLRVLVEAEQKGSPIVVVGRSKAEKPFDRSSGNQHGILAGNDWITQLTLDVKNVSNKNVTYIDLQLSIPKTGKMEHDSRIVRFVFGNKVASTATESLKPGNVVKLRISDLERTSLETYLKKYDARDVEQITMDIREVHFEDKNKWVPISQR